MAESKESEIKKSVVANENEQDSEANHLDNCTNKNVETVEVEIAVSIEAEIPVSVEVEIPDESVEIKITELVETEKLQENEDTSIKEIENAVVKVTENPSESTAEITSKNPTETTSDLNLTENAGENPTENTCESPTENTSESPIEITTEIITEKTSENTTENAAENTTEDATENAAENTTEDATENAAENTTEDATKNTTENEKGNGKNEMIPNEAQQKDEAEKTKEIRNPLSVSGSVSTKTSATRTITTTNPVVKKANPILKPTPNPNIDIVDKKLYLGNLKAACDIPLLKQYNIKYILTVDSYPLPSTITDLPFLKAKYIQVCDIPKEDILNYFDDAFNFLESAITNSKEGGNILVHCNVGVSRSATIVLAFMMRKYRFTLEEAQEKLRSRRSVIGPNAGFLSQLKLYEKMNYKIDPQNEFYKKFRLTVAADNIKSAKILAPPYSDVIKKDPGVCTVRPEPVVYRCKKCRRILASASNLITHREKRSSHWYEFDYEESQVQGLGGKGRSEMIQGIANRKDSEETDEYPSLAEPTILESKGAICTQMIFIEPMNWMANVSCSPNGKLLCPNVHCKSKLGSFSWIMNCVCPCGAKIQPAFYLVPSKVDRSTSVLNLQITI